MRYGASGSCCCCWKGTVLSTAETAPIGSGSVAPPGADARGGNDGGSVGHLVPGRRHSVRREGCRRKRGPLPRRARLSRRVHVRRAGVLRRRRARRSHHPPQAASDTASQPGQAAIYIFVSDVDALYEELRSRGARVLGEPNDYPYGMRDFAITDLDGNELVFGMESTQAA